MMRLRRSLVSATGWSRQLGARALPPFTSAMASMRDQVLNPELRRTGADCFSDIEGSAKWP